MKYEMFRLVIDADGLFMISQNLSIIRGNKRFKSSNHHLISLF